MTDAFAIVAINREQLATATDRLLLQSSRRNLNRRRAASSRPCVTAPMSVSPAGSGMHAAVAHAQTTFGGGSNAEQRAAGKLPRAHGRTGFVRALLALGVTVPTVVGIGLAVAAFC